MRRIVVVICCGVVACSCGIESRVVREGKPNLYTKSTIVLEKDYVKIIEGDSTYYLEYDDDKKNWDKSFKQWVRDGKRK